MNTIVLLPTEKMSLANVFTFHDALSEIVLDRIITAEEVSEK